MALTNQPYLPMYPDDYLTNVKLAQCNAESNGVYIRLIFLLHKSETYGKVLLKQKYEQTPEQIINFALQLARQMPYTFDEMKRGLTELLEEGVIYLEDNFLCQKRMIRDYEISLIRSQSGKNSVKARQDKGIKNFSALSAAENEEKEANILLASLLEQKTEQNTVNVNGYVINSLSKEVTIKKEKVKKEKPVYVPGEKAAAFIKMFNEIKGTKEKPAGYKMSATLEKSFNQRLEEGYTGEHFRNAISSCKATKHHVENPHFLTPEFILRDDKLQMYANAAASAEVWTKERIDEAIRKGKIERQNPDAFLPDHLKKNKPANCA